ncbi:MAG: sodium/glutamate symporter [Candidatus Methylomirabilales bacterium]
MQTLALSELHTFVVGLVALSLGTALSRRVGLLERLNIPNPVVGGVLVSLGVAALRAFGGVEVRFASGLSDLLLLVFFTTVGLSAKFSALMAGGRPLAILCGVTVLMIAAQNIIGVLIALIYGAHPIAGLLVGSISFVGGPGTAAAWAKEAQALGLARAPEVAVAGATLAVIVGAVVAGPITGRLIERRGLHGAGGASPAPWVAPETPAPARSLPPIEQVMRSILLTMLAVAIGQWLNEWGKAAGLVLPGFLTAMLGGVMITNAADALGAKIDFGPIEREGEMSLQAFLAMYLMSLKLWTLGAAVVPLVLNVAAQVVVATLVAVLVLFRALGRDYDAAVTVGGFLGFGLSSMPVAMATMDKVASRYGPSPKAFLLITLAGSFFVDLANAFMVQAFLALPLFRL